MHQVLRAFISSLNNTKGILIAAMLTLACGGGDYYEAYNDSHQIFVQKTMGPTRFEPFFFKVGGDYWYNEKDDSGEEYTANAKEWKAFVKDKATEADIKALLYAPDSMLMSNADAKLDLLDKSFKNNTFYRALQDKAGKQTLDYLVFAKQCEPLALGNDNTWEPRDEASMQGMGDLIAEGKAKMNATSSSFLKLRYAYQLVRLANYSNQFDTCIDYYNKYIEPNKTKSIIRYWALSLKARALYKVYRWNESQYCYAIVFDRCTTRRKTARQGFRWATAFGPNDDGKHTKQEGQTETGSLKFCKDKYERMPVLAMLLIQNETYPEAGKLDSMYAIDPKSEMVEWLMVRGVRELENDMLPSKQSQDPYRYKGEGITPTPDNATALRFIKFLDKVAGSGNSRQPALWDFATAYSYFVVGNFPKSHTYIKKLVDKKSATPLMADQIRMMEDLMEIYEAKGVTPELENKMAAEMQWLASYKGEMNKDDAMSMIWLALSNSYDDDYRKILSVARSEQMFNEWDLNERLINEILAFQHKERKTPFETMLAASFNEGRLMYVKGTIQLTEHRYNEAATSLKVVKMKYHNTDNNGSVYYDGYHSADPFTIHAWDCLSCDAADTTGTRYDNADFAERMAELKKLADHPGPQQARSAYLLANGMYNTTYFGNSRGSVGGGLLRGHMGDYYWPGSYGTPKWYFDCEPPKAYYQKAMRLAGDDREFAAECAFLIAKCERNQYYTRGNKWSDDSNMSFQDGIGISDDETTNVAFPLFQGQFSDTKYYKGVLQECGYFSDYVARVNPGMQTLPDKK